jgi:DNA ligase 1
MKFEKFMTLGRDWEYGDGLRGWWLSEKLEDVRAYWDGYHAWTRGGKQIYLPSSILCGLPEGFALDGGIFAGRGQFRTACNAVQHNHWNEQCRFVAFDAPNVAGPLPHRIAEARRRYQLVIDFVPYVSIRETNGMLLDIQQAGGEGIVARDPSVPFYERGRVNSLLKIKGVIY